MDTSAERIFRRSRTLVRATLKYDKPEVENVARGRSPVGTFSTSGLSYFNVILTTVHHLYNVATHASCGGIFNIHLTANLSGNFPVIFF